MNVLVLPVAGGAFPSQLAIICDLIKYDYLPDITLGSSGGNVTAYIASAADWSIEGIERITLSFGSDMFIKSWWPNWANIVPSWIIGFFRGSIYDSSLYPCKFFSQMFNRYKITKHEIWTGTTDCNLGKVQLFCNRSKNVSIIKNIDESNIRTMGCMCPIYLDGNVEQIALAASASASIPTVVPYKIINDIPYADGGILYASPLTVMQDAIHSLGSKLHLTYLSCSDIDINESDLHRELNMFHRTKAAMTELIKSLCIQDRLAAIELLRHPENPTHRLNGICSLEKMNLILKLRTNCMRSLVEFFPLEFLAVDVQNFKGRDAVNIIHKVRKNRYGFRLWWTGDENIFNPIM